MPLFDCDGTPLYFADDGRGRAVVMIPGLGGSHGMFDPQAAVFRATYRVVRPDLRGNGESGRLTGPVRTILDRQSDDLARVLDQLEINQAVVIGLSYGGVVALHFALKHPDRLAALVIVDTFADIDRTRLIELGFLAISYFGLWVCYLPRPVLKWLARRFYARWPVASAAIPRLVDQFRPTEAVLQSLAMNRVHYTPELGRIVCPTLGIVGDATRTGVRFMRRAVDPIRRSRLEIVRDSFDPSNLCQPEVFNRLVADFLNEIGW